MSEIQSDNPDQNENKPENLPSGNDVNKTSSNAADTTSEEDCPRDVKKKPNIKPFNTRKWWRKHWNKVLAILIQAVLALFTYLLFNQAVSQSGYAKQSADAAAKSANAADSTYRVSKDYDSISIKRQDSILNETERRYEIENRPFLQANEFNIDQFEVGKPIHLTIKIINLGKEPAKLTNGFIKMFLAKRRSLNFKTLKLDNILIDTTNRYVIKESPTTLDYNADMILDNKYYQGVISGAVSIYMRGNLNYFNLITNKKSVYIFMMELGYIDKKLTYDIRYNENK